MGILSDKQIKKLCKPPKFVIEREIAVVKNREDGSAYREIITAKEFSDFDFQDQEKAAAYIEKHQRTNKGIMSVVRELTEEEILSTKPLIYPFYDELVTEKLDLSGSGLMSKIIPYGLDGFIYNIRLSTNFLIYKNKGKEYADPKSFNEDDFVQHRGDTCIIPADCYAVAESVEIFNIPSVITGIVTTSKPLARVGIECLTTILGPTSGKLRLEFMNNTNTPAILYAGEGGAQVMFFRGDITQK